MTRTRQRALILATAGCAILLPSQGTTQDQGQPREKGQPLFAPPVRIRAGDAFLGEGRYYPSPVLHDIDGDGDGDHDLLLGSYENGHLYRQMNEGTDGEPKFTGKNIPVIAGGRHFAIPHKMTAPRLVDWDGDGDLDLDLDLVAGASGTATARTAKAGPSTSPATTARPASRPSASSRP